MFCYVELLEIIKSNDAKKKMPQLPTASLYTKPTE